MIMHVVGKRQLIASLATASSISYPTTTAAFSPRALALTTLANHHHNPSSSKHIQAQLLQYRFASFISNKNRATKCSNPAIHYNNNLNTTNNNNHRATMSTLTATSSDAILNTGILQKIPPSEVTLEIKDPVNPQALEQAKAILEDLVVGNTDNGKVNPTKLLEVAKRLGDVDPDCTIDDLIVSREACKEAYLNLDTHEKRALDNMHFRIKTFAELQRASVKDTEMDIPGGKAGHTVSPCRGT